MLYRKLSNSSVVVDVGSAYIFDFRGMFLKEDIIVPRYITGAVEADAISVLSSGSNVEMAIFSSGIIQKKILFGSFNEALSKVMINKGYFAYLSKKGNVDDMSYTQAIFIYNRGFDFSRLRL